jgi:hypothetical protein
MTQWQPIETAPKNGTAVLATWENTAEFDVLRWIEDRQAWCVHYGGWGEDRYRNDETPTHWMPLPESPMTSPVETQAGQCGDDAPAN